MRHAHRLGELFLAELEARLQGVATGGVEQPRHVRATQVLLVLALVQGRTVAELGLEGRKGAGAANRILGAIGRGHSYSLVVLLVRSVAHVQEDIRPLAGVVEDVAVAALLDLRAAAGDDAGVTEVVELEGVRVEGEAQKVHWRDLPGQLGEQPRAILQQTFPRFAGSDGSGWVSELNGHLVLHCLGTHHVPEFVLDDGSHAPDGKVRAVLFTDSQGTRCVRSLKGAWSESGRQARAEGITAHLGGHGGEQAGPGAVLGGDGAGLHVLHLDDLRGDGGAQRTGLGAGHIDAINHVSVVAAAVATKVVTAESRSQGWVAVAAGAKNYAGGEPDVRQLIAP